MSDPIECPLGPIDEATGKAEYAYKAIVVMEDREAVFEQIQRQLERQGFLVLRADGADSCMDFSRHGAKVFILDIHMGDDRVEEGLHALRALKASDPSLYCILLTNHQTDHYRNEAAKLGCNAFLGKSSKELENSDHILLALDRMLLGRATNLSLGPQSRPLVDEICTRIDLRNSVLDGATGFSVGERHDVLGLEHRVLLLQAQVEAQRPHMRLYRLGAGGLFVATVSLLMWVFTGTGIPFHPLFAAAGAIVSLGVIAMAFLVRRNLQY